MTLPNRAGYQAYQRNKYETASPHKLISLLYDGALSNLARALQALEQDKKIEANRYILKCQDIVYELMACINEEQGGEIAQNLKQLYFYIINQLIQGNVKKQKEPLVDAEGLLKQLRDTWNQIGKDVGLGAV